jgi:hypothetical protein
MSIDIRDGGDRAFERRAFETNQDYDRLSEIARRHFNEREANQNAIPSAWFTAVLEFLWVKGYAISKRSEATDLPTEK